MIDLVNAELLKEKIRDSGLKVNYIAENAGILRETFYNKLDVYKRQATDSVCGAEYHPCSNGTRKDRRGADPPQRSRVSIYIASIL